MIRGIGASKNGMAVEQARSEVLANNLANINTSGFKKSVAVSSEFEAMLLKRLDDSADGKTAPTVGLLGNGAALDQVMAIDAQGLIIPTDRALDFAIEGAGRFAAERPDGSLITTRNGAFSQREDGTLITSEGFPVMMRNTTGQLVPVAATSNTLQIQQDGAVVIGGVTVGRLEMEGFSPESKIRNRALEGSNVELAKEMTDLVVTLRSFQVNQRAMQMQDQTLGRAVSEIGKV